MISMDYSGYELWKGSIKGNGGNVPQLASHNRICLILVSQECVYKEKDNKHRIEDENLDRAT